MRIAVRVFCLGETVAVPLFRHLRERCTTPLAKEALDRILRDEVRHRDFGWDLLDWLLVSPIADQVVAWVTAALPGMLVEIEASYGAGNQVVATDMNKDDPGPHDREGLSAAVRGSFDPISARQFCWASSAGMMRGA